MEEEKTKKDNLKENKAKTKKEKVKKEKNSKANNKQKSNTKKSNNKILIVVLIALIAILLFGLFELYKTLKKEEDVQEVTEVVEHSQEYENIMAMDFQNNYPVGYLEVIEANNEIVLFEYSEEVQFSEAQDILTKQRELFAQELLELNPLDAQVAKYNQDLTNYRNIGCYIVSRKILTSEIISYDGSVAEVNVNEQFNDGLVVQYTYNVIKENDQWKIFSWTRKVIKDAEVEGTEVEETEVEETEVK